MADRNSVVRPYTKADFDQLERWRKEYGEALLEVPHGYVGDQVETAVVERNGKIVLSLTGSIAAVIDPLIKNPDVSKMDIMEAVIKADAVLTFSAGKIGALDAYISVPEEMQHYHNILRRCGYTQVLKGCLVFKKHLVTPVSNSSIIPLPQVQDPIVPEESAGVSSSEEPIEGSIEVNNGSK